MLSTVDRQPSCRSHSLSSFVHSTVTIECDTMLSSSWEESPANPTSLASQSPPDARLPSKTASSSAGSSTPLLSPLPVSSVDANYVFTLLCDCPNWNRVVQMQLLAGRHLMYDRLAWKKRHRHRFLFESQVSVVGRPAEWSHRQLRHPWLLEVRQMPDRHLRLPPIPLDRQLHRRLHQQHRYQTRSHRLLTSIAPSSFDPSDLWRWSPVSWLTHQ